MIRTPRSLRAQLDAYEATSRHHAEAGMPRRRGWSRYAAAAGSGLAMATAADADIIYSGLRNLSATAITSNGPATFKIDMDGATFVGRVSRGSNGNDSLWASAQLQGDGPRRVLENGSNQLKMLASGAKISTGAGMFEPAGILRSSFFTANRGHAGTWPRSQPGFAGVEFTQAGQTHFGWIQLEWTGSNFGGLTDPVPKTLTAIDWAYQSDPDTPILAGAGMPPAVPEPSTAMIALLASGCVGVLAWRKHRRQLAENARAGAKAANTTQPE